MWCELARRSRVSRLCRVRRLLPGATLSALRRSMQHLMEARSDHVTRLWKSQMGRSMPTFAEADFHQGWVTPVQATGKTSCQLVIIINNNNSILINELHSWKSCWLDWFLRMRIVRTSKGCAKEPVWTGCSIFRWAAQYCALIIGFCEVDVTFYHPVNPRHHCKNVHCIFAVFFYLSIFACVFVK